MKKTFDNIFTSADGSIVVDNDFLVIVDAGCEQRTVKDFIKISKKENKPIAYIFLTHFHWDHVLNTKVFRNYFPELITIGHKNNYAAGMKVDDKTLTIGSFEYETIQTPGHSPRMDDICILLKDRGVLFTGDLCQPQGKSFKSVDFVTPVPCFTNGERYIESLKKILGLEFKIMITGHGQVYRERSARNALRITLKTVEAMKKAGIKLSKKDLSGRDLADMIFKEVSEERGFDSDSRMSTDDYEEIDLPGLMYWARFARKRA